MIDEQKAREAVFRIRRARMTGNTEHMSGTECDVLDAFITKAVASQNESSGKYRAFVANLITERGRFEYALQALVPELYTQVRKAVYSRPYEENDHSAFAALVRTLSPAVPDKPVVSDESDDKILWGIVANAGRLSNKRMARWAHVSDATGQGSSSSAELCRRFGFDPDAEVGGDNLDAFLAETEAELVVSDEVQELIVDAFMAGNQRGHESTVEGNWSDDRDIGHEYAVALGVKS